MTEGLYPAGGIKMDQEGVLLKLPKAFRFKTLANARAALSLEK